MKSQFHLLSTHPQAPSPTWPPHYNQHQLDLHNLSHEAGHQPILPLSRALQKLPVAKPNASDALLILNQLLGLRPPCDEVVIEISAFATPLLTQCAINPVLG